MVSGMELFRRSSRSPELLGLGLDAPKQCLRKAENSAGRQGWGECCGQEGLQGRRPRDVEEVTSLLADTGGSP